MRKAKIKVQQRKSLSRATRHRKQPLDKHLSPSWRKRNYNRVGLQAAYAKFLQEQEEERQALEVEKTPVIEGDSL